MNLQENIHRIKEVMGLIVELSDVVLNKAVEKFSNQTKVNPNIIRSYIIRFERIKNTLEKKDVFQYSWDDLETVVDTNVDKAALRVKAGKVDLNDISNTELVYNGGHGVKIFVGTTRESCVKYGNGYSFCISARGDEDEFSDTMYHQYRIENKGTPYFVYNKSRSTDIVDNKFVDPNHLIVIFVYQDSEDSNKINYTVTDADNNGEKGYNTFLEIERDFSELSGLGSLFKPVDITPKEKELSTFEKSYTSKLTGYRRAVMSILGFTRDTLYADGKVHGRLEDYNIWNHELIEKLYTYDISTMDRTKISQILKGDLIPMKMYYSTKKPGPGAGRHNVPQWDDFKYITNDDDNIDFLTQQQFEEYKQDPNVFCEKYKKQRNQEFKNNTWWQRHPKTYGKMGVGGDTTRGWDYDELDRKGKDEKFEMLALHPIKINPNVRSFLEFSLEIYSEYRDKKMELHDMK